MAMMDMGESVLARLKNKSRESGKSLQLHLQLFCQEEFFRRLSLSTYSDNLILKGGLFIYALSNFESRATVDIDFLLRQLPGNLEQIRRIVENILSVDTGNDFISFTQQGFEDISPQRKYRGVSFQLVGHIKNTRTPFNVDIGMGDVIVPKVEKRLIPTQLDGFSKPLITAYSIESTIAEKFDAILQRLQLTSRMKDFYDIYFLSPTFDFDGRRFRQAIFETLQNRSTY
jgi:predicted nucleotidyltransferase component of viral defense system